MATDHGRVARAERPRRLHEEVLLDRQHRAPDHARVTDGQHQPEGQDHVGEAGAEDRHDRQRHQEQREAHERVHDPLHHDVNPSPEVAREEPDDGGARQPEQYAAEPHRHGHPRPVDHPRQEIAPEVVRAQPVGGARRLEAGEDVGIIVAVGGRLVGQQRQRDHGEQRQAPQGAQRLASKPRAQLTHADADGDRGLRRRDRPPGWTR